MKLERLIPMLPVKHLPRSLEFYQRLGFEVENRQDAWGWAMIRNGECRLMLNQSINVAPEAPRQGVLYLYPEHIVEYHRRVRDRGVPVPELEMTFYGLTEFRLEDPDGNRLWIGQAESAAGAAA
jgi:catechol 2,3-dioxygenase-like lactoylglutathione lyase family enzyme